MSISQMGPRLVASASSPIHAILVLLGYMAVLGGLAFWHFQRMDIGGASGV